MRHVFIRIGFIITQSAVLALLVMWSPYVFGSDGVTFPQILAAYFAILSMLILVSAARNAETPEKAWEVIKLRGDWIVFVLLMYWGGFWP